MTNCIIINTAEFPEFDVYRIQQQMDYRRNGLMSLFKLDIHTFIILLAAGNLASIIILPAYRSGLSSVKAYRDFTAAKILQAAAWIMLGMRGDIAEILSVYAGNTMLLAGFCFEVMAITAVDGPDKKRERLLAALTAAGIFFFCIFASTPNIRVVLATSATIPVFLTAAVYFLVILEKTFLRITTGLFYVVFCIILIFRVIVAFTADSSFGLTSPAVIQTLSFMPLYVLIFVSGTGFLLIFREKSDRLLRESENKFSTSFHSSPDAIILTWASDGSIIEVNSSFEKFSSFNAREVTGRTTSELNVFNLSGDRDKIVNALLSGTGVKSRELTFRKKTGEKVTGLISSELIDIGGRKAIISTISDITDRKEMEENIQKLLAEKELLLKEVHHRLKNNLNTVIALLELQAGFAENEETSIMLKNAANRLYSMSIMYDRLYRSDNFIEMLSAEFLKPLIYDIVELFPESKLVEVRDRIGDFYIDAEKLQPLAIIINELVTNSMKHAFKKNTGGFIEVSAEKKEDYVEIIYSDSGDGIPADQGKNNSAGFGMQLVEMLVNQINGSIKRKEGKGTEYIIRFRS